MPRTVKSAEIPARMLIKRSEKTMAQNKREKLIAKNLAFLSKYESEHISCQECDYRYICMNEDCGRGHYQTACYVKSFLLKDFPKKRGIHLMPGFKSRY